MTIQLNADNNLKINKDYAKKLNAIIDDSFKRYSEYLTRIEVHFSDENSHKTSSNDKKCVLEAKLKGREPIAVSDFGDTYDLAFDSAIDKMKASLDTILGKMLNK